jgi:hypothetical protein
MPKVVLQMIPVMFQHVVALVLDLPPRPGALDQIHHMLFVYLKVRYPTVPVRDLPLLFIPYLP